MLVELSKPFTPPGADKAIDVLTLDLESLTGKHLMKASREADAKRGGVALSMNLDIHYHIEVAAIACGLDAEALERLPARDFTKVQVAVQGFLLGAD